MNYKRLNGVWVPMYSSLSCFQHSTSKTSLERQVFQMWSSWCDILLPAAVWKNHERPSIVGTFFFSDKLAWAYWTFQSSLNISVKYGSLLIFSWRKHKTPIYLYKDLFLSVLSRYALNSLSILIRHAIISYPFGHSLCCSSRTNMWGFPLLQSTRRAQLDITAEIVRDNELKRPLATPLARA